MLSGLRRSEWVLAGFFLYIAVLCTWRGRGVSVSAAVAALIPMVLIAIARGDSRFPRRPISIVRDWLPAVMLLLAYWSVDWVPTSAPDHELERVLIVWDRALLRDWGLHAAVEQFSFVPAGLELAYLVLYAVFPMCIASFYVRHERSRLDAFTFPFLVGTLSAYALLPYFPVQGPRFAFPGDDLPAVETVFRQLNLWMLNRWDIQASVFPSGHVAAAWSAAFAMYLAAPRHRAVAGALFVLAILVWINTIYGRYHYAGDGLASLGLSAAAIGSLVAYKAISTG